MMKHILLLLVRKDKMLVGLANCAVHMHVLVM